MKYAAGGALLLLAAVMTWYERVDKGVMTMLLIGAAVALGFQITPAT